MKKLLLIALAMTVFVACDKKDDDEPVQNKGSATYNGQTHDLHMGVIEYWGQWDEGHVENGTTGVDIILQRANFGVYISTNVHDGNKTLVEGTYAFNDSFEAHTFSEGAVILVDDFGNETFYYFTGGTVRIEVDGSIFTVVFDCTANDRQLVGSYTGTLLWADESYW